LERHPDKLPQYGISMRWKTSLEKSLPQLEWDDFEDWLWRRESPKKLSPVGRSTNLRNRDIFLSFADLPQSSGNRAGVFARPEVPNQPSNHWCLLGEIVSSITIHHLELELVDMDQNKFPLHFNTEGRGNELGITKIREGYTVAILYAKRRSFTYGDPGVDHVDPEMLKVRECSYYRSSAATTDDLNSIKIFPVSLNRLLELSDRIQKFSVNEEGIKTCNGCDKKAELSQRCGSCALFWYCDGVRSHGSSSC
jgi:hypothetical protein